MTTVSQQSRLLLMNFIIGTQLSLFCDSSLFKRNVLCLSLMSTHKMLLPFLCRWTNPHWQKTAKTGLKMLM